MSSKRADALSTELLAQLSSRGDARAFSRNTMVITEGEVADSLFIVVSGELKAFTRDSKGRELIYSFLQAGDFFGELFLDGGPRSASVKAIADSECIVVDQAEIRAFMQAYPEFAQCLVYRLIARLRQTTQLSKSLALDGVYERTVAVLNQVAVRTGNAYVVPALITQQEIANRVGATREMVNHIVRDLQRGGFIEKDEARRLVFKSLPGRW